MKKGSSDPRKDRFEVFSVNAGKAWRWRFRAKNGATTATSPAGQTFGTKERAKKSIERFAKEAARAAKAFRR